MALLSLADHAILSDGTFGIWGDLLYGAIEDVGVAKGLFKAIQGRQTQNTIHKYNITSWMSP